MKQVILNFPKQFEKGLKAAENVGIKAEFENIIICGVGGSALPGSLLLDYADDLKIPVYIHRSYGLPPQANEKSLILCVSFSGNTEETISAYREALKSNYKVVAVATGGKLQEVAEANNLPIAIVPNDCLQPRFGTGYLFSAVLKILANCEVMEDKSAEVLEMANNLKPADFEEMGKKLAKKLVGKIPLVYSSNRFKSLARIWKIKFNENSKVMAFWNYFPELNHNEMAALTRNQISKIKNQKYISEIKNFHFLILKDKDDYPRILKRMEITANLIRETGADVDFVEIEGKNTLEKIFNSLILGDWVSYYLALEYGIDPVPVKIAEEFKKRLRE